ncbi:MAG: hypothetical protein M5U16_12290 [Hyphomicrobium sp.]|nr:hypothetical protein [Hyphomicrobium sp.]
MAAPPVLTLYLSLKINIGLRPRILKEMRPGTRVLSNDFNMGDWLPDKWERVGDRVVYLWIVPTQVAGEVAADVRRGGGGARSGPQARAAVPGAVGERHH